MKKIWRSIGKSLGLGLAILVVLVIYAYGFQVTQVNFTEIRSPQRQASLARVLRALARPDLVRYQEQNVNVEAPISVPCQAGSPAPAPASSSGPYLVLNPPCADPRAQIQVEGFNFPSKARSTVYFIPPSQVTLRLADVEADASGHFLTTVQLPSRPDTQVQTILAIVSQNVGAPMLAQNAIDTWNKIIETVFLALLATTFGTALAIPVSFLAARNIMREMTITLSGLALAILAWPTGMWIGATAAGWIGQASALFRQSVWLIGASLVVSGLLVWFLTRWALPQEETRRPGVGLRVARLLVLLVAALAALLALYLVSDLASEVGQAVAPRLGNVGFLGSFLANLGEILNILITTLAALAGGALLSSFAGRLGRSLFTGLKPGPRLAVNLFLGGVAGAVLFVLVGAGLNWLYEINDPVRTFYIPAMIGAALGLLAAILTRKEDSLPIGLAIYYITRTTLNALRAIEALVMVIVFVVWVGIGPFAGVLALSLHTIAALAKLYSEQVESISPGPLEAIKATGATRLQTIIYAVIPQIIPPYISFTMYRWDINVRMSTIIGFAGGGGIGFLLQQNINLSNYRAASAQMLAIAIVVALMDFLSSYLRERVV